MTRRAVAWSIVIAGAVGLTAVAVVIGSAGEGEAAPGGAGASSGAGAGGVTAAAPAPPAPSVARGPLDCGRPSAVVALVDGRPITAERVCAALRRLAGPGAARDARALGARGPQVLERVIVADVVAAALRAAKGAVAEGEVERELAATIERRGDLGASLAAEGLTLDDLRAELRDRLERRRLAALRGDLAVDDRAIEAEYARGPMRWGTLPSATVEGVIARVAEGEPDGAARAAIERAARALAAGQAPDGVGRLAPFTLAPDGMDPALERAVFDEALALGAWSAPVRTKAGWAVLKATARTPGRAPPLAEVRAQVAEAAKARRFADEEARVVAELRAQARVEVGVTF